MQVQRRRESLATELNGRLIERASVIPTKVVDCIMGKIHKLMDKGSIDCKMVSQHMAFTLLGATLFGDAFLVWSKATVYEELLMMIAKDACFWASYAVTPVWKQGFWRYQRLCTKLKCLTQDIVQQCRRNYKLFCHGDGNLHNETANMGMESVSATPSCSCVERPDSFFSNELNGHLSAREEPCGNIMGVMFHGCLTTAGLIGNLLERLVTHPEIQDKVDFSSSSSSYPFYFKFMMFFFFLMCICCIIPAFAFKSGCIVNICLIGCCKLACLVLR